MYLAQKLNIMMMTSNFRLTSAAALFYLNMIVK